MINVAHLYSLYEQYEELENAMSDNIELLQSVNGETVLGILLDKPKPNYAIVNKVIEYIIKNAERLRHTSLQTSEKFHVW